MVGVTGVPSCSFLHSFNLTSRFTQSSLPEGASPLCIILYADKTHLSSFGTQKGYPVLARCANLPTDIRNGEGQGGGILVGWLPIVSQTQSYPLPSAHQKSRLTFIFRPRMIARLHEEQAMLISKE